MFVKGQGASLRFVNHGVIFHFACRWRAEGLVDIVQIHAQGRDVLLQALESPPTFDPQAFLP